MAFIRDAQYFSCCLILRVCWYLRYGAGKLRHIVLVRKSPFDNHNVNGRLFTGPRTRATIGSLPDLVFTDDATLILMSRGVVEVAVDSCHPVSLLFGFTVIVRMTKCMCCRSGDPKRVTWPSPIAGTLVCGFFCLFVMNNLP